MEGPSGGVNPRDVGHVAGVRRQSSLSPEERRQMALSDPRPAERHGRGRAAVAAGELRLIGDSAMLDAIRKTRIRRLPAEVEIGLARMTHRPFADAIIEVE